MTRRQKLGALDMAENRGVWRLARELATLDDARCFLVQIGGNHG